MQASIIALLVIILLGLILHIIGLFSPYWKISDPADTVNEFIIQHQGIWITCTQYFAGNYGCDDFNRALLGLNIELIVGRIVGVLGAIIGCAAILLMGAVACDCTAKSKRLGKYLLLTSALLSVVSGFAICIIMGFYANQVVQQYWRATDELLRRRSGFNRFIFGWSLFVGWIGGAMQILGGFVLSLIACRQSSSEDHVGFTYNTNGSRNYAYRPENPAPLYGKEYV